MKLNLAASLTFASPAAESDPGVRPYQGVAYCGDVMSGSAGPCVIDVSSMEFRAPLPLLWNHDTQVGVGMVDRIETGTDVRIFGRLFRDGKGGEILAKGDRGFPWGLSLGIYASGVTEVGPGETLVANGRQLRGPFIFLRHSRLREISVCSVAADDGTSLKFDRPPQLVRLRNGRRIII